MCSLKHELITLSYCDHEVNCCFHTQYRNLLLGLSAQNIAYYEIKSAKKHFRAYISDLWNLIDILMIILYVAVSIMFFFTLKNEIVRIIFCFLIILAFVKICFFLRIYDGMSFLVSMVQGVFLDLKYFLLFYFLVLILFNLLFQVLNTKLGDEYGKVGKFEYFLMSFRLSTGDF